MNQPSERGSVKWLIKAIDALPSDDPVPLGTPGYNEYTTQKAHWLGWLGPGAKTGSYPRTTGDEGGARNVYNRIVEPKMLLWLVSAAGVKRELVDLACAAAESQKPMAARAAEIRRHVPWTEVEAALSKRAGEA